MDRDWSPVSSVLAAVLGWAGHSVFGGLSLAACPTPFQGSHTAWGEPDADTCGDCPVCTCEEELRELLNQQAALEWWRLLAAALGAVAGLAVVLLALVSLCWAGVCVWCCRTRPGPAPRPHAGAAAPPRPGGARATPELLAILAAREVRR